MKAFLLPVIGFWVIVLSSGAVSGEGRRWSLVVGAHGAEGEDVRTIRRENTRSIASALGNSEGFAASRVLVLLDDADAAKDRATGPNIVLGLRQVQQFAEADDTLVISLAGKARFSEGRAYLVTSDGGEDIKNCIPVDWFLHEVGCAKPRRKLVLVDLLQDGARDRLNGPLDGYAKQDQVAIITTTSASDVRAFTRAKGEDVFGRFVAEALHGAADLDGDSRIITEEILAHLKTRLADWCVASGGMLSPVCHGADVHTVVVQIPAATAPQEAQAIAVVDFGVCGDVPVKDAGKIMSRLLLSEFEGRYEIVTRAHLAQLLAEHDLMMSDLMDAPGALRRGKVLPVKYLVVGDVMKGADFWITAQLVQVANGVIHAPRKVRAASFKKLEDEIALLGRLLCMPEGVYKRWRDTANEYPVLMAAGRRHLAGQDWPAAKAAFEQAYRIRETAEARQGMELAARKAAEPRPKRTPSRQEVERRVRRALESISARVEAADYTQDEDGWLVKLTVFVKTEADAQKLREALKGQRASVQAGMQSHTSGYVRAALTLRFED